MISKCQYIDHQVGESDIHSFIHLPTGCAFAIGGFPFFPAIRKVALQSQKYGEKSRLFRSKKLGISRSLFLLPDYLMRFQGGGRASVAQPNPSLSFFG